MALPSKWELKLHDDVEDSYYELTNGQTTLCATCGFVGETEEEGDSIFKKVADALNESGISWHSENALELQQHIEIQEWKVKYGELKAENERLLAEHADLNLALAAMLNGYQNLSMHEKDWFTVPIDLIDQYTKMVLEYDSQENSHEKDGEG